MIIRDNFGLFCIILYVVALHLNGSDEGPQHMVSMGRKLIPQLSSNNILLPRTLKSKYSGTDSRQQTEESKIRMLDQGFTLFAIPSTFWTLGAKSVDQDQQGLHSL